MVTPVKKASSKDAPKERMTADEKALADKMAAAKTAQAEAKKLAKEAEAEKTKLKKAAEAETAKLKKAAVEQAAKDKAEKGLDSNAKEINTRFEKAEKLGAQADDHRLAAAISLANAKEVCREAGLPYKDWCVAHLKVSEQTVRKMLPVGAAENETKGAGKLMLEDMRNKNKDANKKSRDKKKAEASTAGTGKPAERKVPAGERAMAALDSMPAGEKKPLLASQAENMGMKLVDANGAASKADPKKVDVVSRTPLEISEDAFKALAPRRQIAFAYWVADQTGGKFTPKAGEEADTGGDADTDITDIPESMRKTK